MQRWTGAGTRGKSGSSARRSLVLRFLNSCREDEMKVFIDLITDGFKEIHGKKWRWNKNELRTLYLCQHDG